MCLNPYSIGICSRRQRVFNPYSNGICSRSIKQLKEALKDLESLNPYSNGIYSWSLAYALR